MGVRWLVLLVAVAVVIDISQAMFPMFKEKREKAFKRYLEGIKEKQAAAGKKRQFEDVLSCPLWDCYDLPFTAARQVDEDYDDDYEHDSDEDYFGSYDAVEIEDYFTQVQQCMENLKKETGKLCNCTLDDIVYADMGDLAPEHDDSACWECLAELPSDPDTYAFSCDEGKVEKAEECLGKVQDKTCLTELMGGVEVDPKRFFDGIRLQMKGCPIQAIVEECMDFFKDDYYVRSKYTDCALRMGGVTASGECVKQLATGLPTCSDISDLVFEDITNSMRKYIEVDCAPLRAAIETKAQCCGAKPDRPEAPKKRRARKLLQRILSAKGL